MVTPLTWWPVGPMKQPERAPKNPRKRMSVEHGLMNSTPTGDTRTEGMLMVRDLTRMLGRGSGQLFIRWRRKQGVGMNNFDPPTSGGKMIDNSERGQKMRRVVCEPLLTAVDQVLKALKSGEEDGDGEMGLGECVAFCAMVNHTGSASEKDILALTAWFEEIEFRLHVLWTYLAGHTALKPTGDGDLEAQVSDVAVDFVGPTIWAQGPDAVIAELNRRGCVVGCHLSDNVPEAGSREAEGG